MAQGDPSPVFYLTMIDERLLRVHDVLRKFILMVYPESHYYHSKWCHWHVKLRNRGMSILITDEDQKRCIDEELVFVIYVRCTLSLIAYEIDAKHMSVFSPIPELLQAWEVNRYAAIKDNILRVRL